MALVSAAPPIPEEQELQHFSINDDEQKFTKQYVRCFSPLSQEACRKAGVRLDDLIVRCGTASFPPFLLPLWRTFRHSIRPMESFAKRGLSQQLQRVQFERYETRRADYIKDARAERLSLNKVAERQKTPPKFSSVFYLL